MNQHGPKTLTQELNKKKTAVAVTLASFWRRLFAWIYDLLGALGIFILALAVGQLLLFLMTLPWENEINGLSVKSSRSYLWALYLLVCVQYYYVWCWVKGGQTVGMKTWRLQLCLADGSLLTWRQAYLRSLLSFAGLGNFWCLIDSENRGWHDLLFDSRVVVLPKDYYKTKNNKPIN